MDFVLRIEIQIRANQDIVRLDEPSIISHPPDGNSFPVIPDLIKKITRRNMGLGVQVKRQWDGYKQENQEASSRLSWHCLLQINMTEQDQLFGQASYHWV